MLARTAFWTSAAAMVVTVVLGGLNTFGVGLSAPTPLPDDVSQRILHRFLTSEEAYMLWGRWGDLADGIGFGALIVGISAFVVNAGQRTILVAGAALAVAGEAIDVSKLTGFEIARVGLDNGLGDTFAGGSVFRFAINTTSTYVFVAGLFLLSVGFFLLARSAADSRSRILSMTMAAALLVAGIFDPIGGDAALVLFNASFTIFALALVSWVAVTTASIRRESPLLTG